MGESMPMEIGLYYFGVICTGCGGAAAKLKAPPSDLLEPDPARFKGDGAWRLTCCSCKHTDSYPGSAIKHFAG
jgi:hypothetical protein